MPTPLPKTWWNLLDESNPLSPLHPKHPLHDRVPLDRLRRVAEPFTTKPGAGLDAREPPLSQLPDGDAPFSAGIYGKSGEFDVLPFPNMEWWWNTIEAHTASGNRYFIVTDVHTIAQPLGPPQTHGTVAMFDIRSGRRWQTHGSAPMGAGRNAKYCPSGWCLMRLDPRAATFPEDIAHCSRELGVPQAELARASKSGCYVVKVETRDFSLKLYMEQHTEAVYGDSATPGWYDNNPKGQVRHWASYRSRFQTPRGRLRIGVGGSGHEQAVASGNARFDHRSLHWSAQDSRGPTAAALIERVITRPKWNWYHARLDQRLNVMAYQIWNANTRSMSKVAAAVADEKTGEVARVDPKSIRFAAPRATGHLSAPVGMKVSFDVPRGTATIPSGPYRLQFDYDTAIDWTVDYKIAPNMLFSVQEAVCAVTGSGPWGITRGTGTQEVLDMLTSLRVANTGG